MLKQLSVFVENRVGATTEATGALAEAGVNLRAMCLADTTDFGVLRLIVEQPEQAAAILRDKGMIVNVCNVLAIILPDEPGAFHKVLRLLSDAGFNVEYSYAFLTDCPGKAEIILRVREEEQAASLLKNAGYECISIQK